MEQTLTEENNETRRAEIISLLRQRSWYERSLLVSEFHKLAQEHFGKPDPTDGNKSGWSMNDTADALSMHISTIILDLRLVKCCLLDPTIAATNSKSYAIQNMYLKFSWVGSDRVERRVAK